MFREIEHLCDNLKRGVIIKIILFFRKKRFQLFLFIKYYFFNSVEKYGKKFILIILVILCYILDLMNKIDPNFNECFMITSYSMHIYHIF